MRIENQARTLGMTSRSPAVKVTIADVSKRYGALAALDNVSLVVEPGEFLTLLGPSGSGKTTLLMVLAGFVRPDGGRLSFGERDVTNLPPHRRGVGLVFQNYALFPHMDVFGNIAYPLRQRKVSAGEIEKRVLEALEVVQLGGFQMRRIDQLSGGQKQRVALARAVVFEPPVLLMDEPLSALDKKLRDQMQLEIRSLHDRLSITTIYVTHDQREALTMSDRVAVMNGGRITQVDRPSVLYERPRTKFVADFVGDSTFLPARVQDGVVWVGKQSFRTKAPGEASGAATGYLVLRPEKLLIVQDDPSDELSILPGTVAGSIYQGESFVVRITLDDGTELKVRKSSRRDVLDSIPQAGERILLGLHPEDTLFVPEDDSGEL